MVPEKIGRYDILGELGRGGMATVYRARDPRFQRDVAIKVLPPEFLHEPTFRQRFEREAHTIAALEHPAIVTVHDFGEDAGLPYLMMRFMPGGSMSDRLKKGPLSIPEADQILARLASALERAHQRGIIHRDLKPQNILFDQYGQVFLSDFGSAQLAQASTALTGDAIIGTPAYMSPEQARGDEHLDGRSDVYALGAILFEMLTGQQPYEADTPMGVAVKHITEPVPRILDVKADLPAGCEEIISRAMAKERDDRYASPMEMSRALNLLAGQLAGPERDPSLVTETAPQRRPDKSPPTGGQESSVETGAGWSQEESPAWDEVPARPTGPLGIARWIWILAAVILIGGLCGVVLIGGGTLAVLRNLGNPPPVESLSAPTQPVSVEVLFEDDFSDPASGWDRFAEEGSSTDYAEGGYRILVLETNAYYWANPGLHLTDVIVEVEATKTGGPDDNDYGVICRYQDAENFYFLLITSDGFYSVNKYQDGELSFIGSDNYRSSEAIRLGASTNSLTASCIQDRLELRVNGQLLAQVSDGDFPAGDVGLIAGTFDEVGTEILFDNFKVIRP